MEEKPRFLLRRGPDVETGFQSVEEQLEECQEWF